jgi:hypothetical protein
VKINISAPSEEAAPPRGRTTRSAQRNTDRPKLAAPRNYTNYIIWGVVVAGVLVGGFFVMRASKSSGEPVAKKPPAKPQPKEPEPPVLPPVQLPPPPPPPPPEKPTTKIVKYHGRDIPIPIDFKGGAASKDYPPKDIPANDIERVRVALDKGEVDALFKKPWENFKPVMATCLCDDEKIAKAAFQFLDKVAEKYKMEVSGKPYRVEWDFFTDPTVRAGIYELFLQFDPALQGYFKKEKAGLDPFSKDAVLADEANWEHLIVDLRHYSFTMEKGSETKYTYEESPDNNGKKAFEQVKKMGKAAYPFLVKYILDEDPDRMKTAIIVLHMLTGYPPHLYKPTEAQKAYREWLDNLGLKDEMIPK